MTNENTARDPFDFADVSDLPEELQQKFARDTDEAVRAWAGVVNAGVERGYASLSINQIIAAATRMGIDQPTTTTVRNYLNRAVELRLIGKPTRMTYGSAEAGVVADDQDGETPVAEDEDPLAAFN